METPYEESPNEVYEPEPETEPMRVQIVDIYIPFWRLVVLIVKFALAGIPAALILALILGLISFFTVAPIWVIIGAIAAVIQEMPK